MGPEGAVAAAVIMVVVFVITAVLVIFALMAKSRGAPSIALRCITALQCAVLALGVLLPKSTLRAVEFVVTGRWLVVAVALVGTVLAVMMLRRGERGALRWFLAQLFIGIVMATFLGELIFAVFLMM